jgi:hypothetical protein
VGGRVAPAQQVNDEPNKNCWVKTACVRETVSFLIEIWRRLPARTDIWRQTGLSWIIRRCAIEEILPATAGIRTHSCRVSDLVEVSIVIPTCLPGRPTQIRTENCLVPGSVALLSIATGLHFSNSTGWRLRFACRGKVSQPKRFSKVHRSSTVQSAKICSFDVAIRS